MKFTKLLLIYFFIFQSTLPAVARDDLIITKEASVIRNFSDRDALGNCYAAVNQVRSVTREFKTACESLATKSSKALRQCATAGNVGSCQEILTGVDGEDIVYFLKCCGSAQRSGKM